MHEMTNIIQIGVNLAQEKHSVRLGTETQMRRIKYRLK